MSILQDFRKFTFSEEVKELPEELKEIPETMIEEKPLMYIRDCIIAEEFFNRDGQLEDGVFYRADVDKFKTFLEKVEFIYENIATEEQLRNYRMIKTLDIVRYFMEPDYAYQIKLTEENFYLRFNETMTTNKIEYKGKEYTLYEFVKEALAFSDRCQNFTENDRFYFFEAILNLHRSIGTIEERLDDDTKNQGIYYCFWKVNHDPEILEREENLYKIMFSCCFPTSRTVSSVNKHMFCSRRVMELRHMPLIKYYLHHNIGKKKGIYYLIKKEDVMDMISKLEVAEKITPEQAKNDKAKAKIVERYICPVEDFDSIIYEEIERTVKHLRKFVANYSGIGENDGIFYYAWE